MSLPDSVVHFLATFFAGGTSAAVALTTIAPLERIKLILQIQKSANHIPREHEYKGIIDCLIRIPKEQGFFSFWRGNWAGILRAFPYQAFNFSFKELFKEHVIPKTERFLPKLGGNVLSGGVAGSCALTIIYPLDYARTRMAMDTGGKKSRHYRSVRHCLSEVISSHGFKAIYRGYPFAVFGAFIYRSIYFGLFDTAMECIRPEYSHSLWIEFAAAEFSATTAGFVSYPLDTVRRRMMLQAVAPVKAHKTIKYSSTIDCWRKIRASEGIRGFYHGGLTNVYRGTGGAIMLVMYDSMQRWTFNSNPHLAKYIPLRHHRVHEEEFHISSVDSPCKVFKPTCVFCNF